MLILIERRLSSFCSVGFCSLCQLVRLLGAGSDAQQQMDLLGSEYDADLQAALTLSLSHLATTDSKDQPAEPVQVHLEPAWPETNRQMSQSGVMSPKRARLLLLLSFIRSSHP